MLLYDFHFSLTLRCSRFVRPSKLNPCGAFLLTLVHGQHNPSKFLFQIHKWVLSVIAPPSIAYFPVIVPLSIASEFF